MRGKPPQKSVPLAIIGGDETPMLYANHFVIQNQQNEFILTAGQIAPPMLMGTDEEKAEQLEQVDYVPVKVVARIVVTETRLKELIDVLQTNLKGYQERTRGGR